MKFTALTVVIFALLAHPGKSILEDVRDKLPKEVANLLADFQTGAYFESRGDGVYRG